MRKQAQEAKANNNISQSSSRRRCWSREVFKKIKKQILVKIKLKKKGLNPLPWLCTRAMAMSKFNYNNNWLPHSEFRGSKNKKNKLLFVVHRKVDPSYRLICIPNGGTTTPNLPFCLKKIYS